MQIINATVTLKGCDPKVSRNLALPTVMTLDQLHEVIQLAMPWTGTHYHLFQSGMTSWDPPYYGTMEDLNSQEYTIHDILAEGYDRGFCYVYDFGDCWDHSIRFGRLYDAKPGELCPKVTKARGACPPEDCGGVWGYKELLEDRAKPEKDRDDHWEMFPDEIDPHEIDLELIQELVQDYAKELNSINFDKNHRGTSFDEILTY